MIQLLLALVTIGFSIITVAKVRSLPVNQQKWLFIQMGVGVFCVSLLFILMTGKVHWLGIVVGILIPILKIFLVKDSANSNTSNTKSNKKSDTETEKKSYKHSSNGTKSQSNNKTTESNTAMEIKEAIKILGLEGDISSSTITVDVVIDAHRKLIQKFHPDLCITCTLLTSKSIF